MIASEFGALAGRLMRQPVAPFHEHGARAEFERICAEHDLACRRDSCGNLLVRLQTGPAFRPLVLAAHMDHPGFEIIGRISSTRWRARFLGGVPDSYFRAGVPLRLLPGAAPATLGRRYGKAGEFEIRADRPLQTMPRFGVWELEDFTRRRGRLCGRACDDLVGVASVLATLIELQRRRTRVNVVGVISRAEEIGFLGALAVASATGLPANALVISLETSRELPGARMGRGVILRVGDRTSVFSSKAMRFLEEIAAGLKTRDEKFQFQRALMSGGTCEATAYQEFGFETAGVCVALANYHNCGPRNRIAPEYVSVKDALSMVELLAAAAERMGDYAGLTGKLPHRLKALLRKAKSKLRRSA